MKLFFPTYKKQTNINRKYWRISTSQKENKVFIKQKKLFKWSKLFNKETEVFMNKAEVFEKEVNVSKKKNILFDMEKVFLEEELHKKDEKD